MVLLTWVTWAGVRARVLPGQECLLHRQSSSASETCATGPLQHCVPVLSSVPRYWWSVREFTEECIKSRFESGQGQEGLDARRDHVVQCRGVVLLLVESEEIACIEERLSDHIIVCVGIS